MNEKLLRIYLQDHLAAATAGTDLARRTAGANKGSTYGDALAGIADEIEADKRALEGIMDDLGFGADRAKNLVLWAAEKAGRLKPNGQLTGYSPLSPADRARGPGRRNQRQAARSGARCSRWCPSEPRLDAERLKRLMEQGEEQLKTVEDLRTRAARAALVG